MIPFLFHHHSVFHGKVFLEKKDFKIKSIHLRILSDVPKLLAPTTKRYVSSFKTLVPATNHKQTQRLNYINDSVMIFKLSKERKQQKPNLCNFYPSSIDANENNSFPHSHLSSKHSTLSVGTSSTAMSSKQLLAAPILNPLLKIEGQSKFRIESEKKTICLIFNLFLLFFSCFHLNILIIVCVATRERENIR